MIVVLALAFTLACVVGSAFRLWYVVEATPIDPSTLTAGLRRDKSRLPPNAVRLFGEAAAAVPGADWERDVARAFSQADDVRLALLGEAMTELDFRARRWVRVPRVCASLASSFGFLLATVALRVGLSDLVGTLDPEEVVSVNAAVLDAIDVAAIGLVGTAFCIAIQYRARTAAASRLSEGERFVELLEALAARDGGALAPTEPRASVDALQTTVT